MEVDRKQTKTATSAPKSSGVERKVENYLVSFQNLAVYFVFSAVIVFWLDGTKYIREASYGLKYFLWFQFSHMSIFAIALVYFVIVMWHLHFRSSASLAVAKQQADRKGAAIGTPLGILEFSLVYLFHDNACRVDPRMFSHSSRARFLRLLLWWRTGLAIQVARGLADRSI